MPKCNVRKCHVSPPRAFNDFESQRIRHLAMADKNVMERVNGERTAGKENPLETNSRQGVSPLPDLSQQSNLMPQIAAYPLPVAVPPPPAIVPQLPLFHPAAAVTHNLIPAHMQASAVASALSFNGTPGYSPAFIPPTQASALAAARALSLDGTPGYQPAFISPTPPLFEPGQPVLTVQDRPMIPPVYNGVHPHYPGLRMLHSNPPVFCVDDFLTPSECDFLIHAAQDCFTPAPVVGKGAGEVSASRTSSTCYLARDDLPDYLRKVSLLTGKPVEHCELPQVGRYLPTQQYLQHFDAFDLSNEDGRRFAANGGQRTVTVLVYLNDVAEGGHTFFPALNLKIQPKRGMAVVFFPATVDGLLDKMALHAALPAAEGHVKYVSQVWIRQGEYKGQPSKRLEQTMGVPFDQEQDQSTPMQM